MPVWGWILLVLGLLAAGVVSLTVIGVIDVIGHIKRLFTHK